MAGSLQIRRRSVVTLIGLTVACQVHSVHPPAMDTKLSALLGAHKQVHDWSCSASAHESLAKLQGKINHTDFPLQNAPDSHKAGFQYEGFLNQHGLAGKDSHHLPKDAVALLLAETQHGRYPLVSLLARVTPSGRDWHILVAVPVQGGVALADPAEQKLSSN